MEVGDGVGIQLPSTPRFHHLVELLAEDPMACLVDTLRDNIMVLGLMCISSMVVACMATITTTTRITSRLAMVAGEVEGSSTTRESWA